MVRAVQVAAEVGALRGQLLSHVRLRAGKMFGTCLATEHQIALNLTEERLDTECALTVS